MINHGDKTRENIALFEQSLGQKIPISDRSFLYQLSVANASLSVSIDKKAELAVRENLATTASIEGLTEIGRQELGRDPFSATASTVTATFSVGDGIVIPPATVFISSENGFSFVTDVSYIGTAIGTLDITVISELTGGQSGVSVGSEMTLQTPIVGVSDSGTVSTVIHAGIDAEGTEEYRTKVLDRIRSQGGGSNSADYRDWAQEVAGVLRAYPYSAQFDENGDSIGGPSSRTVFVQATESIDPDGIAPQSLLDEVRQSIITDPSTLRNRICMGVPNSTLFVESVRRISFDVQVFGTDQTWPVEVIDAISYELDRYFQTLIPSIEGLDPVAGRTNSVTEVSISNIINDVSLQYGKNASSVSFSLTGVGIPITRYQLPAGALAKLNSVVYP